jgi:phospholipid transport system substrate-binding protein
LLKHYTSRFSDYSSGGFKVTNSRDDGEGEYTVSMQIIPPDSNEPVLVDYRVRKDNGSYKIFDVIVEGVSMITTQRSEFASVLNSEGIDALIGKLGTMGAPDAPAKK